MSRWKEGVLMAFVDMRLNPVRTFLSLLGIVIGIAAVTAILALGYATRDYVREKIAALGLGEFTLRPAFDHVASRWGVLSMEDVDLLGGLSLVEDVYPEIGLSNLPARGASGESRVELRGVPERTLQTFQPQLLEGRTISVEETLSHAPVCILGQDAAVDLFPNGGAIGKVIRIEGHPWNIVGILDSRHFASGGLEGRPKMVVVAFASLLRYHPGVTIQVLRIRVRSSYQGNAKAEILGAVSRGDPKRERQYFVGSFDRLVESSSQIILLITLVGAAIAAISLLVGGIGVMNVMLTSVAERTREIGLRRALGARKSDILVQFMLESCALSSMGGLVGLAVGISMAQLIGIEIEPYVHQELRVRFQPWFFLLAVAISGGLGACFGIYPAAKAARLSPAEALRAE